MDQETKRYAVIDCSPDIVREIGGMNIQGTKYSGMVFANLTDEQVKRLLEMGYQTSIISKVKVGVAQSPLDVAPPVPVVAVPTYTPSEIVDLVGLEDVRKLVDPPLYGQDITVAVIGTGIRATHQQIQGRVVFSKNYTTDAPGDGFDHDTGVASIIVAATPKVNILDLKVMDSKGEGTEEEVVMAVDDCISFIESMPQYAPSVINLSLGSADEGNPNSPMRVACRAAVDTGIMVFAAAGNGGPAAMTITSPACERYVFSIGSCKYLPDQKTFVVSDFSSRGPTQEGVIKPDGVLFGEDLIMASSASDTATVAKSGTSFSCPFGTGLGIVYSESLLRHAKTLVDIGELPAAQVYYVPSDIIIDQYLPKMSIKPAGVSLFKDDTYGWGMPYGTLVLQVVKAGTTGTSINTLLPMMLVLPMMGMMMKTMSSVNAGVEK